MALAGDHKGYYRMLGLAHGASADEIRVAFRERAKRLHPDRAGGADSELADTEGFKRLTEAYEVLRDPRRRLQYDADGLGPAAADRTREPRPDPAEMEGAARRGERPQRAAPPVGMREPFSVGVLTAATIVLALLLAVAGGVMWRMWGQLQAGEAERAELARRYDQLVMAERELRGRYLAQSIEAAGTSSGAAAVAGRTIFTKEIRFQPDSAEVDPALSTAIDGAVVELSRSLRQVPDNEPWLVVVQGHAATAAAADGVAVAGWEVGLLRIGSVIDRLLAQGLPPERLATQFQAGFSSGEAAQAPGVELKLVCCFD
jgi:outer membrane protein OmpA-like peptidoglycan-associated protein